jgi:hypothetical protein
MNERIRLLAEQAFFDDASSQPSDQMYTFSDHKMQKFAELMVQECAKVCLAQRDPANLNYKPSERFAEAVKQHFGVE